MASTYTFSFSSVSAPDQLYGSGTFDVTGGVIDGIDGWLFTYPVGSYQMTLIDPGGFASNDNVFTGITPFFTESGLSFTAGEMNYNIFNFTTEAGGATSSPAARLALIASAPTRTGIPVSRSTSRHLLRPNRRRSDFSARDSLLSASSGAVAAGNSDTLFFRVFAHRSLAAVFSCTGKTAAFCFPAHQFALWDDRRIKRTSAGG